MEIKVTKITRCDIGSWTRCISLSINKTESFTSASVGIFHIFSGSRGFKFREMILDSIIIRGVVAARSWHQLSLFKFVKEPFFCGTPVGSLGILDC